MAGQANNNVSDKVRRELSRHARVCTSRGVELKHMLTPLNRRELGMRREGLFRWWGKSQFFC